MLTNRCFVLCLAAAVGAAAIAQAPPARDEVDTWVTVTEEAAGTNANAKDEAVKMALRKAVEQACGVFIRAQSKTKDYKAVYDKVMANTVGFVLEHQVIKTWVEGETTKATVKAHVSTRKFAEEWANIAHTLNQENNPRVVVAIAEAVSWTTTGPAYQIDENGTVQTHIEDFLIGKGLVLMDKGTAVNVSKRDLRLAEIKGKNEEIAAAGARFKADVVIAGIATVKYGNEVELAGQKMYQYVGTLAVRAIQSDSARILASKTYTKTYNQLQVNAEDKVLVKLADDFAPELLTAVVEAWSKRANVQRTVELHISGMDYDLYKVFKAEAEKIRGVQALRMREITEGVATIDVEYEFTNENLADRLSAMKGIKLKVTEMNANRIKAKVAKD
ncbi:MAG: hypothetical protein ACE15C_15585 [Phycisphaerae bacterium]